MTTHRRPADLRSGLVIDTHELARQAGAMREVHRSVEAPADIGISVIEVAKGSPIVLDLRLESVGEGILVTGTATVELTGECTRCLGAVSDSTNIDVQELFYYPGNEPADDDEAYVVDDDRIDLEPVLRDAVVLDLPFAPLCREDCRGLCPQCGVNRNDDPDHEHEAEVDARWDRLAAWRDDTMSKDVVRPTPDKAKE